MKIAIPTKGKKGLKEMVSDHFGRCDTYTILNEKGDIIEYIDNNSIHSQGEFFPPEILKNNDIDTVICKELGPRALQFLRKLRIAVYISSGSTVQDIFENWKNNKKLHATMKDICKDHAL